MKRIILILLLFAGIGGALIGISLLWSGSDEVVSATGSGRRTSFGSDLMEDVSVRQHGIYGIDLVKCRSCRIEKRKLGGITIGGFNVLVADDLSVVIPEGEFSKMPSKAAVRAEDNTSSNGGSAREIAERIGVSDGFLSGQGKNFRFSGFKVNGLKVATLDATTNVVPRFEARFGEAKADGLHLKSCLVFVNGRTNMCSRAIFRVKPTFKLEYPGGELGL